MHINFLIRLSQSSPNSSTISFLLVYLHSPAIINYTAGVAENLPLHIFCFSPRFFIETKVIVIH